MSDKIRVGVRPSRLALKQAEEVQRLFPGFRMKIISIETAGDKNKKIPLLGYEESDFFTSEIEEALIDGKIDVAIHSAKDLEKNMPDKLVIAALTRSISQMDCLVSKDNRVLGNLETGAIVGTSSNKRKEAVLRFRPDLRVKDIRGNIEERLSQLDKGDFDAVIIAHAALLRLGLGYRISQIIPEDILAPHPLQGRLAVQIRKDRPDLFKIFGRIHEK
ncbi:MAG: hydroxymethylbilane synthase [Candidatus Omnitrophota bacterium]|nr:hydroxymethylbilane synthase [Candidatus Omnitrophota bacterium]